MNVAPGVTFDVGAWYIYPTETGFGDELDLYAWLNFAVGPASVGIGGTPTTTTSLKAAATLGSPEKVAEI